MDVNVTDVCVTDVCATDLSVIDMLNGINRGCEREVTYLY